MHSFFRQQVQQPVFVLWSARCITSIVLLSAIVANFLFAQDHDSQRSIELVALGTAAAIFLLRAGSRSLLALPRRSIVLLLGFFLFGIASAFSAYSLHHAAYEISILFLLLVVALAIGAELAKDAEHVMSLIKLVGIGCALYSLRVLLMYGAALVSGYQPDWTVLSPGFSNPRFLNHSQTPLLPLIILLCVQAPRFTSSKKVWFLLGSFWWALLFVTEARATILALSIGCVVAVLLRRSHARQFVGIMTLTAAIGYALYALLFIGLPSLAGLTPVGLPSDVLQRTMANPASNRMLLWNLAAKIIASHPWLGVGPHHFAHEGAALYTGAHPHNWILQITSEWGIPALLCLVGAIFYSARKLVINGRSLLDDDKSAQHMQIALLMACTAIFVDALFSGVFVMPQSQLAIILVLGITYAWVRTQEQLAIQVLPKPLATPRFMHGLIGVALCVLIWSVAPSFVRHALGRELTSEELSLNPTSHWSRMWEAGYF